MMTHDTFIVSKAGYKYILWTIAFFIIFSLFGWGFFKFLTFLAFIFFINIYRNPERETPYFQKGAIVSPVDGKVVGINTLEDGYEVIIKSSLLDTSILRTPVTSQILSMKLIRGARLSTDVRKSLLLNEKAFVEFEDENKNIIRVEHILDNSVDGITLNMYETMHIDQGKRYGVMTRGLTKMKLPNSCRLSLHVDDRLRAGETLLGYIS